MTLYRHRFQEEFLFRDANQFMGLEECQSRNQDALDFNLNAALSSVNILHAFAEKEGLGDYSLGSPKTLMHNAYMLHRFLDKFGIKKLAKKDSSVINELLYIGVKPPIMPKASAG